MARLQVLKGMHTQITGDVKTNRHMMINNVDIETMSIYMYTYTYIYTHLFATTYVSECKHHILKMEAYAHD
jgi:hypothetical protein